MGSKYRSQSSQFQLFQEGPTLDIEVSLTNEAASVRGSSPVAKCNALIDTGATHTCISHEIAEQLALKPTSQHTMLTAGGEIQANLYPVTLTFPGSGIAPADWEVMDCDLSKQKYDMLVGRDILGSAVFIYNGPEGIWELSIPSTHAEDSSSKQPRRTTKQKPKPQHPARKKKSKPRKGRRKKK